MTFEIPFIRPVMPSAETIAADVRAIVRSNWFTNFGPQEQRFRAGLAAYLGEGVDIATFANATVALMGALSTLLEGSRPGRDVIVPSFTFAAGPHAIRWAGHHPLFIDVDEETLQPSLAEARAALTSSPRGVAAILLCNTFGIGRADIGDWETLAAEFSVPLVIDSAAGFGSRYPDGRPLGVHGDCEIFSFHATKPFAIGEGGAIATRDHELAARLRRFTNFGFGEGGAVAAGLNGKLQEINAAIGNRQLLTIDAEIAERRHVLSRYGEIFAASGRGRTVPHADISSVCFAAIVVDEPRRRDSLLDGVRARGIEARAYYAPPVHLQPAFLGASRPGSLPVTELASARTLALPVFDGIPETVFDRVAEVLADA